VFVVDPKDGSNGRQTLLAAANFGSERNAPRSPPGRPGVVPDVAVPEVVVGTVTP
jgi:hypothetical protein